MIFEGKLGNVSPKKVFLVDFMGAFFTSCMLGLVLPYFESVIGLAKNDFYLLSAIALVYSLYSFTCYLMTKEKWRPFLKVIAFANLLYCSLTIGMVVNKYSEITGYGILYFSVEATVIITLALFELKIVNRSMRID